MAVVYWTGIEDWQLFKRLGVDETSINNGDDLIAQVS